MDNAMQAAEVKQAKRSARDQQPLVVVVEANRASQWTAEEAWDVRWEKVLAAAE